MAGSLEFDDFSSNYLNNNNKSTFRKAGDAFTVGSGNTINNSKTGGSSNTGGSAYDKWMTFMGSQSANNNSYSSQSNNQNAQTSASGTVQQPVVTEDAKSVKTPNTSGGFKLSKAQQEIYDQNLKIIGNYNGKNANNSTANGAAYNADVMSGINYDRAVRQNEKFDAIVETQNSIASGADHGTTEHKAPKSKDYYSYLDTYDGPKTYDEVTKLYKAKEAAMGQAAAWEDHMKLGKEKARPYDKWEQWKKDKMDYEAAWGSGQSVASQKGWN